MLVLQRSNSIRDVIADFLHTIFICFAQVTYSREKSRKAYDIKGILIMRLINEGGEDVLENG